jgi:hypothetical protein
MPITITEIGPDNPVPTIYVMTPLLHSHDSIMIGSVNRNIRPYNAAVVEINLPVITVMEKMRDSLDFDKIGTINRELNEEKITRDAWVSIPFSGISLCVHPAVVNLDPPTRLRRGGIIIGENVPAPLVRPWGSHLFVGCKISWNVKWQFFIHGDNNSYETHPIQWKWIQELKAKLTHMA